MIDVDTGQVVKICGLMDEPAARAASLAGADLLGFILAESRRQVTLDQVREIRSSIRAEVEAAPGVVGVMVNPTAEMVIRAADEGQIDYVQLSGNESPDLLDELDLPVIKTIHVASVMTMERLLPLVDPWFDHVRPAVAILIDAQVEGVYGGSGTQSDWIVAGHLAERYPALLAGGLKPGNVFEGIQAVGPRGVDVSSGVEIGGVKDHTLIESFVVHARQAFAARFTDL